MQGKKRHGEKEKDGDRKQEKKNNIAKDKRENDVDQKKEKKGMKK